MDTSGANIATGVQMEELSEDLIHHILGLLPTIDATQFSILSKPLRSFWLSFPVLDFDFTHFLVGNRSNSSMDFFHFVEQSLQIRGPHIKKHLQKLRFNFTGRVFKRDVDEVEAVVNRLLEFAIEKSVRELDLDISVNDFRCREEFLKHSPFLLRVLLLRSLTSLKLKLKGFESGLSNLSLTSPSLEYLSIYNCMILKTISVSSDRLKHIKLSSCPELQCVRVEAESLESFMYHGVNVEKDCEIEIFGCGSLRSLTLRSARISREFFEQLTGLLCLQFLFLSDCYLPESLNICNSSLQTVEMIMCHKVERLVLSAKSLERFIFHAYSWNESRTLDISACTSLSDLQLICAVLTYDWVKKNISALSFLQVLVLNGCTFSEKIEFKNEKLERLELEHCDIHLKEADIDAPNLLHFSYSGSPSDLAFMFTSTKFDARISLKRRMRNKWFGNLVKFLSSFNHGKSLTLCCSSAKDLIFLRENIWTKVPPLPYLRHLTVELTEIPSTPTLVELVQNLLWFVPNPAVMTIVSGSKKYSFKKSGPKLL
ncbi:hypothetical protein L6164_012474 [Bauhinia variegata]|uniref:Uncharacterized protein n=1 Tax=Bauhinia variegata TaxID=167791 RepID=A0ACB9P966_BAUVA|nr:hypothetical protein L6164_012474 [Bauhinia variegata]